METNPKKALTREKIIGMQVIDGEGIVQGTVRDLSLCVGEMDQALLIEDGSGEEKMARWSEVVAVGDVILLGKTSPASPSPTGWSAPAVSRCPSCGGELEVGATFCGGCGARIGG